MEGWDTLVDVGKGGCGDVWVNGAGYRKLAFPVIVVSLLSAAASES